MKVYLAAPWVRKYQAAQAKAYLQSHGIDIISTWTDHEDPDTQKQAISNWTELQQADTFVILNLATSEGKATELGGALMAGKRVIVVGPRSVNSFYHLPQVEQAGSIQDVVKLLCN